MSRLSILYCPTFTAAPPAPGYAASRYTFSGKERDSETGYSYLPSLRSVSSLRLGQVRTSSPSPRSLRQFGAWYYRSDLSIRLSVDPLTDKYPSLSPYVYCANNPVRLVDPDGREFDWGEKADGTIYWDDNATSPETTKEGEKYLGKNVLVATHGRDENLNEPVNGATFDLYIQNPNKHFNIIKISELLICINILNKQRNMTADERKVSPTSITLRISSPNTMIVASSETRHISARTPSHNINYINDKQICRVFTIWFFPQTYLILLK